MIFVVRDIQAHFYFNFWRPEVLKDFHNRNDGNTDQRISDFGFAWNVRHIITLASITLEDVKNKTPCISLKHIFDNLMNQIKCDLSLLNILSI